jgi:uncharacterized protein YgiM (DUF1202 family)
VSDRLAKRKKRRRAAFWVFFTLIVLVGVGAGAALVGSGSDDSSTATGPTSSTAATGVTGVTGSTVPTASTSASPSRRGKKATTTTEFAIPVFRLYKVTDGVNIRSGPSTTFPVLGTVETGFEVQVICVTTGENVNGPFGATNKWLRVVYKELNGYITSQYVAVGPAINDPSVIGTCKGT